MDKIKKIEEMFENNDIESTIENIELLNEAELNHHKIQNILGILNMQMGEYDNAELYFKKALESDEYNLSYLLNLEYIYEMKNYFAEAKNIVDRAKNIVEHNSTDVSMEELNSIDYLLSDKIKNKNVLMIAYYYPPLSGSGVFRSLKFSKYLSDYNWNTSVISATTPPNGWKFGDESLCNEIPQNVYVKRINDDVCTTGTALNDVDEDILFLGEIFDELPNAKKLFLDILALNEGFSFLSKFPCSSLNWANKVCKYIDNMVHINNFDVIYTTSGPSSSHLVGYYANKKYGIPWVADFRDEWVFNPYFSADISKNIGHLLLYYLESIVCQSANHIVCVSDLCRKNYINYYDVPENKITCITNGYDETDFIDIDFPKENNKKFVIYYGGLIYSKERNFEPIIQAVYELVEGKKLNKADILFNFSGVSSFDINKIAQKYGFKNNIIIKTYQEHQFVIKEMVESDLLVCLVGDGERYYSIYTGKIFEYLRACRPILALASPEGLVGSVLERTGHGKAILSTDLLSIGDYILEQYNLWKTSQKREYCDSNNINEFERKALTGKLTEVFSYAINYTVDNKSKKEIPHYVYDIMYSNGGAGRNYFKSYTESFYYNSWIAAIRRLLFLNKDTSIIDIGCGVGQFANMLFDYGFLNYKGIDYSQKAIDMAKQNNPNFSESFRCADAFTDNIFSGNYEVAILFEIIEHIQDDIKVLERIKSGTKILFSVPNFLDPNHVRYFDNTEEIINRYGFLIDILDIQVIPISNINKLYLATGIKK